MYSDGCTCRAGYLTITRHEHQTALNPPAGAISASHNESVGYLRCDFALFGDAGTSRDCPPALAALTQSGLAPSSTQPSASLRIYLGRSISLSVSLSPLSSPSCPPPFRLVLVRSIRASHLSVFSPRSCRHITPALIRSPPQKSPSCFWLTSSFRLPRALPSVSPSPCRPLRAEIIL
ncbi:uncharacterized protein BO80DRAFT_52409 [Aspergillus ibericus CBS 121593]|uniref:Uncharacterized protein n=1 Tax=Aspergillus ibericus CBS 121593 TaxID=1448316 RepID=A0A395H173_9EURO|nr:hypothetical protein BO80DRAFT_52409 [Aspergillus ibericus CBS 121593]RAL01612.1 hypothetical protein BO80DRAFT_52409 [Aspergillus ibericus CBS 121593]